ncbi:hypothetical protein [Streptomyces antibioticus]
MSPPRERPMPTLTMLQSIRSSASASAWTARMMLSHVPSADHLR